MFYNGANCDIYIGKGAGKKLLHDIRNAKASIKIVSPYLSPFLISKLISCQKQNLEHVQIKKTIRYTSLTTPEKPIELTEININTLLFANRSKSYYLRTCLNKL